MDDVEHEQNDGDHCGDAGRRKAYRCGARRNVAVDDIGESFCRQHGRSGGKDCRQRECKCKSGCLFPALRHADTQICEQEYREYGERKGKRKTDEGKPHDDAVINIPSFGQTDFKGGTFHARHEQSGGESERANTRGVEIGRAGNGNKLHASTCKQGAYRSGKGERDGAEYIAHDRFPRAMLSAAARDGTAECARHADAADADTGNGCAVEHDAQRCSCFRSMYVDLYALHRQQQQRAHKKSKERGEGGLFRTLFRLSRQIFYVTDDGDGEERDCREQRSGRRDRAAHCRQIEGGRTISRIAVQRREDLFDFPISIVEVVKE